MNDSIHPAATFTAARHELLGPDALLGSAEIARGVCRRASRRLGLLAITRTRMRRIDAWLADDALVTHPIAPSAEHLVIGTVCARHHADDLVGSIIEALVGPLPSRPAGAGVTIDTVGALSPSALPEQVGWFLLVSAVTAVDTERWAVAATSDGLVAAPVPDPRVPVRLHPIGPLPNWNRIVRLIDGAPAWAARSEAPPAAQPPPAPPAPQGVSS